MSSDPGDSMLRSGGRQSLWLRIPLLLAVCAALAAAPGCQLFEWSRSLFEPEATAGTERTARSLLGALPAAPDAIEIEVLFAERPVGDPLLGPALWGEIDELTVPLEVRRKLKEHGFLTGVTAATPPLPLQTLIGMSFDVPDQSKQVVARRFVLPSGGETEIQTSFLETERTITVPLPDGRSDSRGYENSRGVLRLKARRLQDGFAQLEFLPELHHGPMINRYRANSVEWQYSSGQKVERFHDQRFSVDLHLGEFAVISTDGTNPDSLGHHFFIVSEEDSEARTLQRVLVVRLAGMARGEVTRAE
jgi:hypothetical protein